MLFFFSADRNEGEDMTDSNDINTYPDCKRCGHCCELNVIAITDADLKVMHEHVRSHGIIPVDQNSERCCFQRPDRTCMIWEARPQICRLHNCNIPRKEILRRDPSIHVPDDIPLRNLHEEFVSTYIEDGR